MPPPWQMKSYKPSILRHFAPPAARPRARQNRCSDCSVEMTGRGVSAPLALGALEASGAAATAALERTLARAAFRAVGRMAGCTLRMALAATIGLGRASFAAPMLDLALVALPLIISAALAGRLDRRAGSRRTRMAMATVTATSAEPATAGAATALFALRRRQLERFQRCRR